jgi:hypothetical protein
MLDPDPYPDPHYSMRIRNPVCNVFYFLESMVYLRSSPYRGLANGIFSWGVYYGYGLAFVFGIYITQVGSSRDLAEWLERLTANAVVATVLGSIPACSDTVESEERQLNQC